MDRLGRPQLIAYAAVGIALLIVGARWLHSAADEPAQASGGGALPAHDSGASGGFSVGASQGEDVVVDVTGAVRRSGVYRLPAGSRVDDAVARAGGATGAADLEAINLAARLADGQQIQVPIRASGPDGAGYGIGAVSTDPSSAASTAPISLGSATVEQLDTIEGIGPVTAQDIIDFRDQHGGVGSITQLDQISGIGPATMEALRARLQP